MSPVTMPSETISRPSAASEAGTSKLTLMTLCLSSMGSVSRMVTGCGLPFGLKRTVAIAEQDAGGDL